MTEDCDELSEDEWPNDDEANDVMLAYEATDGTPRPVSGCTGLILVLTIITLAVIWTFVRLL
jgi:hypothetical protein